jgi:hypothetical protein
MTSVIVSMMREYENQRQSNVIDAWKNGGEFEGKKATDEMLLKFFDDKLKDISPSDPMYEDAKNTAEQYRFAVRDSKQELLRPEEVGGSAMAGFHHGRHPIDSEEYRSLMKLAAQYTERAATTASRGSGRARAASSATVDVPKRGELAFQTYNDELLDLARQRHILNSAQSPDTTTQTTGESFGDLQVWQGDFSAFATSSTSSPTAPVRGPSAQLAAASEIRDPHFDGNYDAGPDRCAARPRTPSSSACATPAHGTGPR